MLTRMIAGILCLSGLTACGGGSSDTPDASGTAASGIATVGAGDPAPRDDALAETPLSGDDDSQAATAPEFTDVGVLRIALTWNARPRDLDAHLTGPEPDGLAYFHLYPGNRNTSEARLVDDATRGGGPETVEIERTGPGVYRFSVFNFSGDVDRPLAESGARVAIFANDAPVAMFTVPSGAGNLWTVFELVDGQIREINSISRLQNVLDYFPTEGRELASALEPAPCSHSVAALRRVARGTLTTWQRCI